MGARASRKVCSRALHRREASDTRRLFPIAEPDTNPKARFQQNLEFGCEVNVVESALVFLRRIGYIGGLDWLRELPGLNFFDGAFVRV